VVVVISPVVVVVVGATVVVTPLTVVVVGATVVVTPVIVVVVGAVPPCATAMTGAMGLPVGVDVVMPVGVTSLLG
jgi:hypothetical protein